MEPNDNVFNRHQLAGTTKWLSDGKKKNDGDAHFLLQGYGHILAESMQFQPSKPMSPSLIANPLYGTPLRKRRKSHDHGG